METTDFFKQLLIICNSSSRGAALWIWDGVLDGVVIVQVLFLLLSYCECNSVNLNYVSIRNGSIRMGVIS